MNPHTRFRVFMLLGSLMGLSICMVIAPVWDVGQAVPVTVPVTVPPPTTSRPKVLTRVLKDDDYSQCVSSKKIRIAETRDPYVCSYMKVRAGVGGPAGCVAADCPEGTPECRILTSPSRDDMVEVDGVIYHPGKKLPVERGWKGQWAVMWYGESGEKHPEMYTEKNLEKYNAHVMYKESRFRFSWAQRFRFEFENIERVKEKWTPWAEKRTIVAIVSNCKYHTTNRTAVIQEVDRLLQAKTQGRDRMYMYGNCHPGRGKDSVKTEHPECRNKDRYKEKLCIMRHYKYAISLDNSVDPGYVTEKVYHALLSGAVPLYAGAPDIADYIPLPTAILRVPTDSYLGPVVDSMLAAKTPPAETEWWGKPYSTEFNENLLLVNPACTVCKDIAEERCKV